MRTALVCSLFGLLVFYHPAAGTAAPSDVGRGYLGVGLADAPPGSPVQAAMMGPLDPNGPAARAGLRRGDLIRAVNGHAVQSGTELQQYVFTQPPGTVLVFDVLRRSSSGYSEMRVSATLTASPGSNPSPNPSPAHREEPVPAPPAETSAAIANVHYVRWTDPAESAFSADVPSGWRVGGRLMRYGPITIAPFVQAMTPNGTIFVQLGDWRIKDYSDLPGWRQGQIYTPGTSIFLIRRLESAEQYAESYSVGFEKQLGCSGGSITGSRAMPVVGRSFIPQSRLETHMVTFSCTRGGQRYVGRVMDTVQSYHVVNSMSWNIIYLACLLAREDRAATGVAVFDRMRTTSIFEPAWNARESQIAAAATAPARAALDNTLRQSEAFDQNVINGEVTVADPMTGARSGINIGAAPFYFADGAGHFYNSYDPTPRPGFHTVNPVH